MVTVFYSHHMPGWGACESIKEYKYLKCAETEVKRVNNFEDPYMVCRILVEGENRHIK